jgi:gamma-glutamyltranspeptidase / glutathione hydrolase
MTMHASRRQALALLLATTALPGVAFAQAEPQQPIISDWPRRQPVFAAGGMVASQEALATRIGVEVLEQGGNAVDAAVAVGFALAVTLPRAGNIGGGGFMIVHRADRGETKAIDFRETAPASAKKDMYLKPDGSADLSLAQSTGLGVGIPGTVAGMAMALERFGSGRYTIGRLIQASSSATTSPFRSSRPSAASSDSSRPRRSSPTSTARCCRVARTSCSTISPPRSRPSPLAGPRRSTRGLSPRR